MYDKNNIFAKIIRNEIPSKKIYEDENVLSFYDIEPSAPIHALVIPKGEYSSFDDFSEKATDAEIAHFFKTVRKIANDLKLSEGGYRIISNHGSDAGQTVPHFHVHILAGKKMFGLLG